jgi:hypothetical protein
MTIQLVIITGPRVVSRYLVDVYTTNLTHVWKLYCTSAVHAALFMPKSTAEPLSNVDNLRGYASCDASWRAFPEPVRPPQSVIGWFAAAVHPSLNFVPESGEPPRTASRIISEIIPGH